MFVFLVCEANKDGAKHREHISLDESDEQLKTVHEQQHQCAEKIESYTEADAHRPTEEDDTCEAEHHGVTCHHVGKETNHKSERLGENAEELYDWHQRHRISLEEYRHMGPEDIFPIRLVAEEVDGNHGTDGKEERHVDVARNVGATREYRKQTENVCREDEEEHREQVWCERLEVLLAYRRLDNVVVDGHDEHLHHSDKSARSLTSLVLALVPAST